MNEKIFDPGRIQIVYDDITINIYDRERMLVEAMRNSKALPFDYKELIASYRKISGELDFRKIEKYISIFKRNQYLFNILQREVL